jgi:hypothetical protein
MREHPSEVLGDQFVRRVCRAHYDIDSCCLDRDRRPSSACGPNGTAELCLAPGVVCLCYLHDSAFINRVHYRPVNAGYVGRQTKSQAREIAARVPS